MKLTTSLILLSSIFTSALAAPTLITTPPPQEPITGPMDVKIHQSCNATERNALIHALSETEQLAQTALTHILTHGPSSPLYKKYFGNGPTAEPVGWFSKLISASKPNVLLRCDDIDGNCHQDGWAGHWRGDNATEETVICPLSYSSRRPLEQMCALGYNVAAYKTNVFFASDLVHRFFHVPTISELVIDHFTDSWEDCIEFAKTNGTFAVRNTNSLQFFALEAFAFDIAVPGVGCPGKGEVKAPVPSTSVPVTVVPSTSVPVTVVPTPTLTPTTTKVEAPATTSDAATECHTHADGVVHCS